MFAVVCCAQVSRVLGTTVYMELVNTSVRDNTYTDGPSGSATYTNVLKRDVTSSINIVC
jgi:hypothetical protein